MERANINYRINGFDLTQFEPMWDGLNNCDGFNLKSSIDFAYNFEQNIIKTILNVDFLYEEKVILKIQLCTFVKIKEESAKSLEDDGKIIIPADFLAQCASFGHGALRGIMYLKTLNTPLEGVIFPPVVYHNLFKKPIIFNKKKENV